MTCEEYDKAANGAAFRVLVHSLTLPVLAAASAARMAVGASKDKGVEVMGADAHLMIKAAREMEEAAKDLRKAAEPAINKPVLMLAAE